MSSTDANQAFAPCMVEKGWGRIIHITEPDAFIGLANRVHHVTAKGGLRATTKSLAVELGQYGLTVNDVAPGAMTTENNGKSHPQVTKSGKPTPAVPSRRRLAASAPARS